MKFKYGDRVKILNSEFFSNTVLVVIEYSGCIWDPLSCTVQDGMTYGLLDPVLKRKIEYIKESELILVPTDGEFYP